MRLNLALALILAGCAPTAPDTYQPIDAETFSDRAWQRYHAGDIDGARDDVTEALDRNAEDEGARELRDLLE